MMRGRWTTLWEALNYVAPREGSIDEAKARIFEKIRWGEIPICAERADYTAASATRFRELKPESNFDFSIHYAEVPIAIVRGPVHINWRASSMIARTESENEFDVANPWFDGIRIGVTEIRSIWLEGEKTVDIDFDPADADRIDDPDRGKPVPEAELREWARKHVTSDVGSAEWRKIAEKEFAPKSIKPGTWSQVYRSALRPEQKRGQGRPPKNTIENAEKIAREHAEGKFSVKRNDNNRLK